MVDYGHPFTAAAGHYHTATHIKDFDAAVEAAITALGVVVQPAITKALTTGFTTSSATPVVITGVTLTPGAGEFQVEFTTTVTITTTNATVTLSIFQNGSQVVSSVRPVIPTRTTALLTNITYRMMLATNDEVTLSAAQAVDIRIQVSAGSVSIFDGVMTINKIRN